MKKIATLFVLAVLAPSLALAWLAIRSVRDQQFLLERQQSLLYQGVADRVAEQAQEFLATQQRSFTREVDAMLSTTSAQAIAPSFDDRLRSKWPLAQVGFVVTMRGDLLAPSPTARAEARMFCADNGQFLGNREIAEVYLNNSYNSAQSQQVVAQAPTSDYNERKSESSWTGSLRSSAAKQQAPQTKAPLKRSVVPQQALNAPITQKDEVEQLSKWAPSETEFRQLIGEGTDGTVARFVNDKLNVLFWYRPSSFSNYVFGAQLDLKRVGSELKNFVVQLDTPLQAEICAALLDDSAKPVAQSRSGFTANWRRPFVATEIGEALPQWEIGIYLLNPAKLTRTAEMLKLTFGLLIALLIAAIGIGGWLIVTDLRRQLALARQKTDFVSNVSHELKTPLTSIRMFSELLADNRVVEPEKQKTYLNIITAEAARLTRLINNVLDFARLERGEKKYNFQRCDLIELVRESCDTFKPHLDKSQFTFRCELPEESIWINADRDAVAQILVNLLSNAEKYSGETKEVLLQVKIGQTTEKNVEVHISDRGLGVPRGCENKIFEQFFRAHDSLASGIQGSGLGLTLSRQIARAHGGDVLYQPRNGGGSCFILRLPVAH